MLSLAQTTPPPDALASFLQVAFYLLGIVGGVVFIWKQLSGKSEQTKIAPQPLEVKAHEMPIVRAELEKVDTALHGRIKRERNELDARIDRVEQAASERANKLDEKIDRNTELTAATRGEVKLLNQNVTQLTSSLTNYLQSQANR